MKYLQRNRRVIVLYTVGIGLLLLCALAGLLIGSSAILPLQIFRALLGAEGMEAQRNILLLVRIPRTLAAAVCGAALSVSGAVIQSVLSNSLASPSIIGVNSGAGLAVTVCAAFGIIGGATLSLFAFLGAFLAVMLVSLGARKWGAGKGTVILMGVALNSLFGAVADTVTAFSPNISIMNSDFRVGDFSSVSYAQLLPCAVAVVLSLAVLFALRNELQILTMGDDNARGLGLNASLMRVIFLLLAAVLAGAAVSVAGLLSFVGLLVPHGVRRLSGGDSGHTLPLCALFGAVFVALADQLARSLLSPYELPVGIFIAFLGAPFFLFILIKGKGGEGDA